MDLDLDLDMDLDLNLGPSPSSLILSPLSSPIHEHSPPPTSMDLRERIRRLEEITLSPRHRWRRWRQGRTPPQPPPDNPTEPGGGGAWIDLDEIIEVESGEGEVEVEVGEGSSERCKRCRRNSMSLVAEALNNEDGVDVKEGEGKSGSGGGASFFDCYICFEMAKEPVLTSCGHLFCWPCLYQWIHLHSSNNECPVCKGEVKDGNITPIYGRGGEGDGVEDVGGGSGEEGVVGVKVEIPARPKALRVESLRQSIHRAEANFSFEEILRRFISRSETNGEPGQAPRNLHRASRILSRLRANAAEIGVGVASGGGAEGSSRTTSARSVMRTRSRDARGGGSGSGGNGGGGAVSDAERLVQAYFLGGFPRGENNESSTNGEDRDSVSSIAAVIRSESQTTDTAIEIDSDMDSVVSRSSRRRRLNQNLLEDVQ